MANRHVMIPEDIWRGMLRNKNSAANNPPTGDINLDYSRRSLDAARKNIQYNQQLRRYLHLRKEHENRPVKVEVVAGPNGAIPLINNAVQQPASMYSGGDDDDDDPWFDDDMSFGSLAADRPPPPPGPRRHRSPRPHSPPVPRQVAKRKVEEEGADDETPPTKKIKTEPAEAPAPPSRQRRVRQRPQGRRQRQRRQQKERWRKQQQQQQQQQNIAAPRDLMRSDQPDEDAAPGPSNSVPPARGVKRPPLRSMRPPRFYAAAKRHKPNPPKPRRRGQSESPPPTKQFRPSLW